MWFILINLLILLFAYFYFRKKIVKCGACPVCPKCPECPPCKPCPKPLKDISGKYKAENEEMQIMVFSNNTTVKILSLMPIVLERLNDNEAKSSFIHLKVQDNKLLITSDGITTTYTKI